MAPLIDPSPSISERSVLLKKRKPYPLYTPIKNKRIKSYKKETDKSDNIKKELCT